VTGLQHFLGDGRMKIAREGVDDQIEIVSGKEIVVICVTVAAILPLGALASIGQHVSDGDYLKALISLEILGVNVASTASLSQDAHPQSLVHECRSFIVCCWPPCHPQCGARSLSVEQSP